MSVRRSPASKPARLRLKAGAGALAQGGAQEVRLVGGRYKRTPLPVPHWPGLRPTPGRVRETLFNWLGQDLHGWRVLDAFAGSGALGLEAASRGAAEVVLLEREPVLARHIQTTIERLGAAEARVLTADAPAWMRECTRRHADGYFDLVCLDPPFDAGLFDLALAAAAGCVPVGGWIYLESPHAYADAPGASRGGCHLPDGLALRRQGRAGAVHYHLIERVDGPVAAQAPAG